MRLLGFLTELSRIKIHTTLNDMDKDLDNANPTILSAAQMPTRQKKRIAPTKGPDAKYTDIILAKPAYLSRPFCDDDTLWPDRDVVDDDFAEEPIDEQEIYGERHPPLFSSGSSNASSFSFVMDLEGKRRTQNHSHETVALVRCDAWSH